MHVKVKPEIRVSEDTAALNSAMAKEIARLSKEAIAKRGAATVVLSGGSTPKALYALMGTPEWRDKFDWAHIHLYWEDERFVPPDSPDNNYGMVKKALLSQVSIPDANVHRVMTEKGKPEEVAAAYEQTIRRDFQSLKLGSNSNEIPQFDIIILGLGTNGHTASLFPHTSVLDEKKLLVAALYVEEVKMERITMTLPLLNNARNTYFFLAGAEKAEVVKQVLRGPRQPEQLPAQLIEPYERTLVWMMDKPAARLIT
jgi:6-phosphogluconolactonase